MQNQSPVQQAPSAKKHNPVLIGCGAMLLLLLVFALIGSMLPEDESKTVPTVKPTRAVSSGVVLSAASVTAVALDAISESNRSVPRVSSVLVEPLEGGAKNLSMDLAINDNLSSRMIGSAGCRDAGKIAQALRDRWPDEIGYLSIMLTFTMKDKYGAVSEGPCGRMAFQGDTLRRIQFENLGPRELLEAADAGWVAPSLDF